MSDQRLQFDIAVVGGGPAGIAAACAAAESGCSVVLLELTHTLGGQIWRSTENSHHGYSARKWLKRISRSSVKVYTQAAVFDSPAKNLILAETLTGVLEIRYRKLIVAVGARELFIPFPGWTLPGVFGIGGLHNLAKLGWNVKGKRIVLAGSGPLLFAAGAHLRRLGAKVIQIAEQADLSELVKFGMKLPLLAPSKIIQAAVYQSMLLGVPYKTHCWPVEATGTDKVESVTLTNQKKSWTIPCDYLACAFGLCTNLELPELLGCQIRNETVVTDSVGKTSVQDIYCVGEPTGVSGVDGALAEGLVAGYDSAGADADAARFQSAKDKTKRFGRALDQSFALRDELKNLVKDDTIICRCEDATFEDIKCDSLWREAKLYRHLGMGPCQGRTCGGAVRYLFGWQKTSARPPVFPVRVGSLAGIEDYNRHETAVGIE